MSALRPTGLLRATQAQRSGVTEIAVIISYLLRGTRGTLTPMSDATMPHALTPTN
jgi:hypothetical protein